MYWPVGRFKFHLRFQMTVVGIANLQMVMTGCNLYLRLQVCMFTVVIANQIGGALL